MKLDLNVSTKVKFTANDLALQSNYISFNYNLN